MSQVQYWVDGDGATRTYTLPSTPDDGIVDVYWNGVLQPPDTYSLTGAQVTLNFTPEGGSDPDQVGFLYVSGPSPAPTPLFPVASPASLIQVSEVVNDPDLAQPFTILRSVGAWSTGTWVSTQTSFQGYGVIANPTVRELEMVPEGDRVKGVLVFWAQQPLYGTHATNGVGGSSDIFIWRGHNYRVLHVFQFEDYGYYRAVAVRMKAD